MPRKRWQSDAFVAAWEAAGTAPKEIARSRQARWDSDHMRTASCRLTVKEMERLRRATKAEGVTIYGLLRYMIGVYLQQSGY